MHDSMWLHQDCLEHPVPKDGALASTGADETWRCATVLGSSSGEDRNLKNEEVTPSDRTDHCRIPAGFSFRFYKSSCFRGGDGGGSCCAS